MSIQAIKVINVMAFQNQPRKNNGNPEKEKICEGKRGKDAFELHFSEGINVIIGENGTGKTTLLKMIYAATQWSNKQVEAGKTERFHSFFSNSIRDGDLRRSGTAAMGYSGFKISDGEHTFSYSLSRTDFFDADSWRGLNIQSVFIPTTEMLSHSKGFLALNEKFKMPFDETQVDIIVNASLPEARSIPNYMEAILEQISGAIDGTVIQENDTFYVLKKDGRKIDFSLEAEGLRKLALLWKLIRNGLLERGTILLWDEPEANLNPELFPLVAGILLELQRNGVQIFIATHSYNFAKYLELFRTDKEQVQFHNLFKRASDLSDAICNASAFTLEELQPNHLMRADEKLLDMVYEEKVSGK